ncbi:MAG: ATP-binding cassette domain-containing protein [Planctomycetota bacterium]
MNDNTIEIGHVGRRFGRTVALDDVSLSVPQGIVMGMIGENGAGKTTLIKHVLGLLKAKAGEVRVFGLDPVRDPVGVLGRIGYLSETRDLPEWMTIGQLMRYTQPFYPGWDQAYAEQLCETFELDLAQKIKTASVPAPPCWLRWRTVRICCCSTSPPAASIPSFAVTYSARSFVR